MTGSEKLRWILSYPNGETGRPDRNELGYGVQNYQSAQLARSMFKQCMDKSTNEIISSCDKRQKRFNHFIQLVECMRSQPTID